MLISTDYPDELLTKREKKILNMACAKLFKM